ncbi:MAG: PEP-CTERM sorting domain-containing protein [Pirellulales bacterium]
MLRKFFALLVVAGLATSASAATVTLTLQNFADQTYTVTAESSAGDNGGIRSYVFGLDGYATLIHQAPRVGFALDSGSNEGPAGFTSLRSANNPVDKTIRAGQDLLTPHLITGFGQTDSSFAQQDLQPGSFGNPQTQLDWGVPLLLASGTWVANAEPSFLSTVVAGVNVIDPSSPSGSSPAEVRFVTIPVIPEPSTFALAGLALVGFIGYARRRK